MPSTELVDFERINWEERPQARRIAEFFAAKHPKFKILDVGCGPGLYVEEMHVWGLIACGIDSDPRLVETDWLKRVDLLDRYVAPWKGGFDVVLSLEVGEHIAADYAGAYVDAIVESGCGLVYFSAARPGQGGQGHINCQPKAYWVRLFHQKGFFLNPDRTDEWIGFMRAGPHMGWVTQNGMILERV